MRQDDLAGMANVSKQFAVMRNEAKPPCSSASCSSCSDERHHLDRQSPEAIELILQKLERANKPREEEPMRSLNIFIGTRLIGEFFEGDDIWTLQYTPPGSMPRRLRPRARFRFDRSTPSLTEARRAPSSGSSTTASRKTTARPSAKRRTSRARTPSAWSTWARSPRIAHAASSE